MYRCAKCGQPWDDSRAHDNEFVCTRRCGGQLVPVPPLALLDLEGCDFNRLPYPVALTAHRLDAARQASGDVLKTLFLLKDCFEATIKYLSAVMLTEYRRSSACTTERTEVLLKSMVRPSLGTWVSEVVRPLSLWLIGEDAQSGSVVAALFAEVAARPGSKPAESALFHQCKQFVKYRNDALGHGAQRRDAVYERDLAEWFPLLRRLLDGAEGMAPWRLCLVTAEDRCQIWMGPQPGTAIESGSFSVKEIGHYMLRGLGGEFRDLYPFLCYLPDIEQENRLHYYDHLYRYKVTKKEVTVLEYDNGMRHPRSEPASGLEELFTADLLAKAFNEHRGRMAVIDGRVANFGELIEAHTAIVGRKFVIDHVRDSLVKNDRGLLLIEGQPGKGKTALMAHLIEEVFGQNAPPPVHFFFRRTAGITDPDVCVRSLYHALLEAHAITEAEESKQKNSPEDVYVKLTNLLSQDITPRLMPGRPQIIFIDGLDEAAGNAFQRIPENLPAGIYIIATTRPVSDRTVLARRQHLHWYDLDAPDLLQDNLRDGFEYVQQELVVTELTNETLEEIARIGAGNFLVLKLLCEHLRSTLPPDQVPAFLRRLVSDGGENQLGFIYAEFWNRLTERCTRDDVNLLCDVAGMLVTARAPLTADMICGVFCLRAGDWDFALRHLAEYLTIIEDDEEGVCEHFYRIYHESFADFLRAKVATDRDCFCNRLADYCLRWSQMSEGYGRTYALRFSIRHLLEVRRSEEAAGLLLDLFFLEAKTEAGFVFELAGDFKAVAATLSQDDHRRRCLELIEEAIRCDIHFIARHPETLFQCLWNRCWWYDCLEATNHYKEPEGGWLERPPWEGPERPLSNLLASWRRAKEQAAPDFCWLRLLRPPPQHLGTAQQMVFRGHEHEITCVALSSDGRLCVSGSADGTILLWNTDTGEEIVRIRGHERVVCCVAIASDGRFLASGTNDSTIRMWETATGNEVSRFRPCDDVEGYDSHVCSVAFAPDGHRLASASVDATVRIWETESGVELLCLRGHEDIVWSVAFAPDGSRVVSGSQDRTVRVWNADTGAELDCLHGHEDRVTGVTFSPQGDRIASGSYDQTVRVWDATSGVELHCLRGHEHWVNSVAFAPIGDRIVSGSFNQTVRVWDTASGAELRCLRGHEGNVTSVAFAPDGRHIFSGSHDKTVRVWDTNKSNELLLLRGHEGYVMSVAIAPDGHSFVSGSEDKTVRVWDTVTGTELRCLRGHEDIVWSVAIAPDGRRLASGSHDRTVRVWNAVTGAELHCLFGHGDTVRRVAFSSDGCRLVSDDGSETRIWDPLNGKCMEVIKGRGDVTTIPSSNPWRVVVGSLESVVESVATGEPFAWLPIAFQSIKSADLETATVCHPLGHVWAGGAANYFCIVSLEGRGMRMLGSHSL